MANNKKSKRWSLTGRRQKSKKPSAKSPNKRRFPLRLKAPSYFSESYAELKKVTWPTRKEAIRLTIAVFIFSTVFTVLIVVADYAFKFLAERLY